VPSAEARLSGNSESALAAICTRCFNVRMLVASPVECIYVFGMVLRIENDYFFCNSNGANFLGSPNPIFKCELDEVRASKI
jgi:hypothetical protein